LLGHSKEVGSIKPGKFADVVAVTGDPLKDISLLEQVQFVMKDGEFFKGGKADACNGQTQGAY
jgi:imidazolonepropionase-like amidohydrolase